MATARSKLIDRHQALHYHLTSRCVRRSFLCGVDKQTGKNYDHRKTWIEERMKLLAQAFAIEIDAFAIMSNHFHLVIYYDPSAADDWSDAEVADRWVSAFPPRINGEIDEDASRTRREAIAGDPSIAASRRADLGSVSMFMKYLKQPIAFRANKEDDCDGHFWEQRFYSGAILDEDGLIAAMAYVDLNPIRAKIVRSIKASQHTSIHRRLTGFENSSRRLKNFIRPVASGLGARSYRCSMTEAEYIALLEDRVREYRGNDEPESVWARRIASIGKYQRAYRGNTVLAEWLTSRRFRPLESRLPE